MKIRAKLILALLLLAVVPLTGIVLYSYFASRRAVRATVEREAQTLTAEMEGRLEAIGNELQRRVERLGAMPFRRLLGTRSEAEKEELLGRMLSEMGEAATLVEAFELVPMPADAPQPPGPHLAPAPRPPAAPEVAAPAEPAEPVEPVEPEAAELEALGEEAIVLRVTDEIRRQHLELERQLADLELPEEARRGLEAAAAIAGAFAERMADTESAARAAETPPLPFGPLLDVTVREEGRPVGQVKARVSAEELLRQVLLLTRRDQGEIPYALDAEGRLFVAAEADRDALAGLDLERSGVSDEAVIVYSTDPESGYGFGIVRPISESLAEIKRTAGRNFAYGLGLIGLALLGILPLSRRMTRDLAALSAGAERIAAGDLTTRVPVRTGDELGHLAKSFNDMAYDLSRQQERLVAEERRRRDEEVERHLLEAEYRRKSRELEEAREFQLSLLPKELPRHPSFEVAVHMQTANEVGGDYYDFHLAENGTLTAAVGDATGHGARAGTMVTAVKSLFSAYAPGAGLARFLINANRTVRRMDLGRMSMGLVLAELRHGTLTVSAAGMPPALIHRSVSGEVEEVAIQGMPLGGLEFAYREERRELLPGDTVLLLSDGLPELADPGGEPMGYARVRQLFAVAARRSPAETVAELAAAVPEWTAGGPPNDDVTFVVLRVRETEAG